MQITRSGNLNVLNNKDEYNRCLIPVIQVTNPVRKQVLRKEKSEEEIEQMIRERPERKCNLVIQEKRLRASKRKRLSSLREFFFVKSKDQSSKIIKPVKPVKAEISSARSSLKPSKRVNQQI